MAITYRGSSVTGAITAVSGTAVMSVECTPYSKVRVDIMAIQAQLDSLVGVSATGRIMPLFKVQKCTGSASGGMILSGKAPYDSQQSSDAGVVVRQSLGRAGGSATDIIITGTPKTVAGAFSSHNASIYGQHLYTNDCIFTRAKDSHIYLNPGELILVTWNDGTTPVGGEAIFMVAWEEDSLGTEYTISGSVTNGGSPVTGAKVILVMDIDRDIPNPQLEVLTTGAPGTWTKTLASGVKADAFVQYRNGETLYTAEGKPYLAKP